MNHIADYAVIGDCHSLALVGRDGSIDWACFPRFDSPSVFCRILDPHGGHWAVAPERLSRSEREYVPDTNVLVTRFVCDGGVLELTDCMPVTRDAENPTGVGARQAILRRLHCTDGAVDVRMEVAPRFEYASFTPRFRVTSPTNGEVVGGHDALAIRSTGPIESATDAIVGRWHLGAGEEIWVEASWTPSYIAPRERRPDVRTMRRHLEETLRFWRTWISECAYRGIHEDAVRRSALALKALTYAPSGAVVAAGTTSLPEEIGGVRNWDYRYTWVRDATLTLASLSILGFIAEANAFHWWFERTGSGRAHDLQIMYGICGERLLPEFELPHLKGHRGSAPVRVGNGAVKQMQLDCYGQILEAAYLFSFAEGALSASDLQFLAALADVVCHEWRKPDHGIWEIRDTPRHFVHSKLLCWVALDRAVRMADNGKLQGDVAAWRRERDALRDGLLGEADSLGYFSQAWGIDAPDASALLVPALGLVPTNDPLVEETVRRVRKDLERDGLVYRYLHEDGLAGGEGAFLLCSFWLLDCLTHSGRLDEAEGLLDRLVSLSNDVGLFAEEVDVATGEALGNFPQAFTHMALVSSCSYLSAAREGRVPADGAHDYAELALSRLLEMRPLTSG